MYYYVNFLSLTNSSSFNVTPTTEIYTLSLHDALPICRSTPQLGQAAASHCPHWRQKRASGRLVVWQRGQFKVTQMYHERSEEHTSELQSQSNLVCRLLLEKKNKLLNTYH